MKAHRLLNIDRGDYPRLLVLAPTFAVVAASTVILASLSKALFLSGNPISLLPWMFLGAAVITAATSLGYVTLMQWMPLAPRFRLLLGVAATSLFLLRLGFPIAPSLVGIVILLWCPAAGHLLVVQTWNVASSLLPTRQGKRLMPVLAAVTTLGAALGGLLVQLLLRWLQAEDLLVVAALALLLPLARVQAVVRGVGAQLEPTSVADPPPALSHATPSTATPSESGSAIAQGFASIFRRPLLADLAVLSFLLQAASLVVDYQFSAELKPQFDKEGIAAFLGTFYWTSNLAVLVLTLLATSRFVRLVGIGLALATSGIVIGVGSGLYFATAATGMAPMFWVIAATAFAERVAAYAFVKPAVQMVYMPLQTSGGERAKTIIDGVIYRLATVAVSVLLLVAVPDLHDQFRLSLPAVIACAMVVYLGTRIGPHYRRALFEALRARRLDADLARYLRDGLGGGEVREIEAQLRGGSPEHVLQALAVAKELQLPPSPELLVQLAEHDDERVARGALQSMRSLEMAADHDLVARMLAAHRPPKLLRALLVLLSDQATPELAEVVRPLTRHEDAGVASAACVFRIRAAGAGASFDAEVRGSKAQMRLTGMTRAGDFARELPELMHHPQTQVRQDAVEQMGELGLAMFVAPLIACLDRFQVRAASANALVRFGDRAMAAFAEHIEGDELRLAARVALLKVVERIGSSEARVLLVRTCQSEVATLRQHAVEALWRQGAERDAPRLAASTVRGLIQAELDRLQVLSAVELLLIDRAPVGVSSRHAMFACEVSALQTSSERRVFHLMGLLYDRDALHRAYLHYRSPQSRVRSNAIELLEQHITDVSLASFVALIERQEDAKGNMRPRSMVVRGLPADGNIDTLVAGDAWLTRLWCWIQTRDHATQNGRALDLGEPLDRLVRLKEMELFAQASGEPLLEMASALERRAVVAGECIFERGSTGRDVYWVLDGEVDLEPARGARVTLQRDACFGEVAALDGVARCVSATATTDGTLAQLSLEDFEDAIELSPVLLRGMIQIMSRRLRPR